MNVWQFIKSLFGGRQAGTAPGGMPVAAEPDIVVADEIEDEEPAAEIAQTPAPSDAEEEWPVPARPVSRMDQPAWKARFENTCAMLAEQRFELVWLGDSCVQQFERSGRTAWQNYAPIWTKYYKPRGAINLGFAGDDTGNLLWRMMNGHLEIAGARAVVVMIGTNNVGRPRFNPDDTVRAMERIVGMIAERVPAARIVVLSLWPNGRSDEKNALQVEVNEKLRRSLAGAERIHFVDVSDIFVKDGQLDLTKFRDPLQTPPQKAIHPSAGAQEEIAERIEPILAEVFK